MLADPDTLHSQTAGANEIMLNPLFFMFTESQHHRCWKGPLEFMQSYLLLVPYMFLTVRHTGKDPDRFLISPLKETTQLFWAACSWLT